jgi:hypothetical protein
VLHRATAPVHESERDEYDVEAALAAQGEEPSRDVGVTCAERGRALRRRLVDPAGAVVAPGEGAAHVHHARAAGQGVGGERAGARGLAAAVGGKAAVGQPPGRHRSGTVHDRVGGLAGGQQPVARGVQLADDRGLQEARGTGDVNPAEPQIIHSERRYARSHNGSVSVRG